MIEGMQEPDFPGYQYYENRPVKAGNNNTFGQRNNSFTTPSRIGGNNMAPLHNSVRQAQGSFIQPSPIQGYGNAMNTSGNLNSSVNDLDVLRQESKLRLKSGIPYKPQQQQYDPSTQSNTGTQPGPLKDISYYTGGPQKNKQPSNLNLGKRLSNYTPTKQTQVNLRNRDERSNSNLKNREYEKKPHSNVMYKGRERQRSPPKQRQSPQRMAPEMQ
jgi:hypothetical protein